MADKTPVAIRISRPWDTEEELLANELETLTRTSVVLVGAQQRPDGVVLRFEVTLRSGTAVLRGEGRVVGYKQNALGSEPGLTLRFTRLDSKSKAFVDRAAARRDGKARPSLAPPPPAAPASDADADTARASSEEVAAAVASEPAISVRESTGDVAAAATATEAAAVTVTERAADPPVRSAGLVKVVVPPDREMILERLRERGRALSADRVRAILARSS